MIRRLLPVSRVSRHRHRRGIWTSGGLKSEGPCLCKLSGYIEVGRYTASLWLPVWLIRGLQCLWDEKWNKGFLLLVEESWYDIRQDKDKDKEEERGGKGAMSVLNCQ